MTNLLTADALISALLKTRLMGVVLLFLLSLTPVLARADEMARPRSYKELQDASFEPVEHASFVPVKGSRVAWANYAALRRDFTQLTSKSDLEIDQWITENFAYISLAQLKLRGIRVSDLPDDMFDLSAVQKFSVPKDYLRASVAQPEDASNSGSPGLVDLKGSGHTDAARAKRIADNFEKLNALKGEARQKGIDALRTLGHSDGMMSLGEAIAEVTRQLAIQAGFDLYNAEHKTSFQTVESYFVIHLPFLILKNGNIVEPSAIYGRQAHIGRFAGLSIPQGIYEDDHGYMQGSYYVTSVDCGGVLITQPELMEKFGNPNLLPTSVDPRNGNVQRDPQKSLAWIYGHETAAAFAGMVSQDYARARWFISHHIDDMLSPLKEKLAKRPVLSPKLAYLRYIIHRLSRTGRLVQPLFETKLFAIWFDAKTTDEMRSEIYASLPSATRRAFYAKILNDERLVSPDTFIDQFLEKEFELSEPTGNMWMPEFLILVPPRLAGRYVSVIEDVLRSGALNSKSAAERFLDLSESEQSRIIRKLVTTKEVYASERALMSIAGVIKTSKGQARLTALVDTVFAEAANWATSITGVNRVVNFLKEAQIGHHSAFDGELNPEGILRALKADNAGVQKISADLLSTVSVKSLLNKRINIRRLPEEAHVFYVTSFLDKHRAGSPERYRFLRLLFADRGVHWNVNVRTAVWNAIEHDRDPRADAVQELLELPEHEQSKPIPANLRHRLVPRTCEGVFS